MIRKVMDAIYPGVGGLDVHEETVVACRRRLISDSQAESEVEIFKTTSAGLRALSDWLAEWKVTQVAMESTGVYWIPVWNVLEGRFKLTLENAQRLKKVPGRKDDITDAEWVAQCMQCGLLRGSFVPPLEVRQWRQLTRHRTKLVDQRTSVINRIHSVLEQGNIKLSNVASDIMGVSGRAMIKAMSKGESDPARLAALAKGQLQAKYERLVEALDGRLEENQRWMLGRLLEQVGGLDQEIESYSERIKELMSPYQAQLERLDTIGGVGLRSAENILAEIGPDMEPFPTDDDLVSWGALCPGKNESGGKQGSRKTPKGNKWLKRALVEAGWAATHEKDSYLAALYRRLAPRRGKKRAIIAVARTILQSAWHILKEGVEYKELGGDHFDRLNEEKSTKYFVKRLEKFGYEVVLKPKKAEHETVEPKPKRIKKSVVERKPKKAKGATT
jgi:transposase